MKDLYFRFESHAEMVQVCEQFGWVIKSDNGLYLCAGNHQYAIYEVGEIPGTEGWHVNMRIISDTFDLSAMEPYQVIPRQPRVVWA